MGSVWVLSVGEYSDRKVAGVFSDEHQAKEAADLTGGSSERFILDGLDAKDPGMDFFFVEMSHSGKAERCHAKARLSDGRWTDEDEGVGQKWKPSVRLETHLDNPYQKRRSYWRLFWEGYAKSKEHAIREANEIRRQILAGQRPPGVDMGKN